jgi:hypothetical protein
MKKIILKSLIAATVLMQVSSCTKSRTTTTNIDDIKTFTGQMECIWNESVQANPKAFLDIDNGMVYDVNTASEHANEIDLIWSECSGGSIIQSPNQYYDAFAPSTSTSPNFQTAQLFTGWSQRNQTNIDYKPSQTVADYNAITTNTQLLALIGTNFNSSSSQWSFMECTNADFGKIYYVETTTAGVKKRGYIHFISGQKGNNNFVKFEIKIQK